MTTNHRPSHPIRSQEIRQANEKTLLRLIHSLGPLPQSRIAAATGLQPSTVFRIFADLEVRGIIRVAHDDPAQPPKKGRRPVNYELNPDAAYAIGVDLAGNGVAVMLVDFRGRPLVEREIEFTATTSGEGALEATIDLIEQILTEVGVERDGLLGIGLGAPGVVDIEAGKILLYSRFPALEGVPLETSLSERLGVPVYLHNNSSVVALAESRYGRAAGRGSVVAILIRAGVGGAYVKDGELYTNRGATALEIGQCFLNSTSADAPTLEEVLAEPAIKETLRELDPSIADLEDIVACMSSESDRACELLTPAADALFGVARNISLLLNPEAFLIIARHIVVAEFFTSRLNRALREREHTLRFEAGEAIAAEYDPMIACRGAVDLVFDQYFSTKTTGR